MALFNVILYFPFLHVIKTGASLCEYHLAFIESNLFYKYASILDEDDFGPFKVSLAE